MRSTFVAASLFACSSSAQVLQEPDDLPTSASKVLLATQTSCNSTDINRRLVRRLNHLCTTRPSLRVVVNIYDQPHTATAEECLGGTLPSCTVRTSRVPGMKLEYWWSTLVPTLTSSFDFVWLVDNDMDVARFDLDEALETMRRGRIALAQPRVTADEALARQRRRGRGEAAGVRIQSGEDMPTLTANNELEPPGCRAQKIVWMDTQTPLFTAEAWSLQHERFLSRLNMTLVHDSDEAAMHVWCGLLERYMADGQTGCSVLSTVLATDDVGDHHPLYGQVERERAVIDAWLYAHEFGDFVTASQAPDKRGECVAW